MGGGGSGWKAASRPAAQGAMRLGRAPRDKSSHRARRCGDVGGQKVSVGIPGMGGLLSTLSLRGHQEGEQGG